MRFVVPTSRPAMDDECLGYVPDMLIRAPRDAELVYMRPEEFLEHADPSFDPEAGTAVDFRQGTIDYIMEALETDKCFAPLELWPNRPRSYGLKHEGRHRAYVAALLGIDEVPVYMWH